MTELTKLQDRLAKIVSDAETVTRYGRVLEIGPTQTGLDLFAQDIEETRFERRLLFRNERHEELGLHVIAGRIIRLTRCDLKDPQPEQIDMIGCDISVDDPTALGRLAAAVRSFCDDVKILYVKAEPPPASLQNISIGVNLDTVLATAGKADDPPSQRLEPVRLAQFVERAAAQTTALLHIAAQDVASATGGEDMIEALLDLAESELQFRAHEAEAGRATDADEHCIILGSGPIGGDGILCASLGGDLVFATFPADSLSEMLALWRACKLPLGQTPR